MKPKISTGYFTPQGSKTKKKTKNLSGSKDDENSNAEFNNKLFESMMKNPEKKKLVLQLLALNKDAIKEYQEKEVVKTPDSVKKVKKKVACESPTALYRRRALEHMNRASDSPCSSPKVSSKTSDVSVDSSHPVDPDKVFEGVTAFVEVLSNGQDRSEGVKSILRKMGAKVKDRISSDVTHVIFKGGSFTTYNKANIIKAHIVSILWVETSRKALQKQDEELYHAIRNRIYDDESSFVCSQIEKEYEDLIREEYKKSLAEGTPLPSTESLINRRRTMMAPSASSNASFYSARASVSPQKSSFNNNSQSQENKRLTSNNIDSSDMELTVINGSKPILSGSIKEKSDEIFAEPSLRSNKRSVIDKRRTICSIVTDSDKTPSDLALNSSDNPKMSDTILNELSNSNESIVFGKNSVKVSKKFIPTTIELSSGNSKESAMSSLRVSSLGGSKKNSSNPSILESSSTMSKLNLSSGNTKESSMSSLKLSSVEHSSSLKNSGKNENSKKVSANPTILESSSTMSKLNLSSGNTKESSMSSLKLSSVEHSSSLKNSGTNENSKKVSANPTILESSSTMSKLNLSSGNTKESSMSSLKLSSVEHSSSLKNPGKHENSKKDSSNSLSNSNLSSANTKESSMSSLRVSSLEQRVSLQNSTESDRVSFASSEGNSSGAMSKVVDDIVRILVTPKPQKDDMMDDSVDTDDSEIVSPARKGIRKSVFPSGSDGLKENVLKSNKKEGKNSEGGSTVKKGTRKSLFPSHIDDLKENELQSNNTKETSSSEEDSSIKKRTRKSIFPSDNDGPQDKVLKSNKKAPKNLERSVPVRKSTRKSLFPSGDDGPQEKVLKSNKKGPKNLEESASVKKSTRKALFPSGDDDQQEKLLKSNKKGPKDVEESSAVKKSTRKSLFPSGDDGPQEKLLKSNKKGPKDVEEASPVKKSTRKSLFPSGDDAPQEKVLKSNKKGPKDLQENSPVKKRTRKSLFLQVNDDLKETISKTNKKNDPRNLKSSTSYSSGESDPNKQDSGKKSRRKRRLYDPDDPVPPVEVNDDEEREARRLEILSKKKPGNLTSPIEDSASPNKFDNITRRKSKRPSTTQRENVSESSSDEEIYRAGKPKKARKVKRVPQQDKTVDFDSSADEQRELLKEVESRKVGETESQMTGRRRSMRVFKPPRKYGYEDDDDYGTPRTQNRRSTIDFNPPTQRSTMRKAKKNNGRMSTIVCTKLHRAEVQVFTEAVKKLGRFTVENVVGNNTSHLVAGEAKRTLNMMKAVARGCWVLNYDWILQSLKSGKWLPEVDFEVTDFAPVVQTSRLQRQAFGHKYTLDVFQRCGPIYVAPDTNPKCPELRDLIVLCKGQVVNTKRRARIIVGETGSDDEATCVTETWVLDCVTSNRKMPFKEKYLLKRDNNKKRVSLVV
ncbi:microcephalin [Sitophilus oryzae]|uniref:Microcephalin n=1 Tax=Sitophilus oryzae TaxID=7048 RepID=A0A6J2X5M0_SITOR|nr:microcephalin [Sitophilus oryzae]